MGRETKEPCGVTLPGAAIAAPGVGRAPRAAASAPVRAWLVRILRSQSIGDALCRARRRGLQPAPGGLGERRRCWPWSVWGWQASGCGRRVSPHGEGALSGEAARAGRSSSRVTDGGSEVGPRDAPDIGGCRSGGRHARARPGGRNHQVRRGSGVGCYLPRSCRRAHHPGHGVRLDNPAMVAAADDLAPNSEWGETAVGA
jgi:hypothetical protein